MEIRGAKILIVDDKPANSLLLEHVLAGAGYNDVTAINDSRNVVDLYKAFRHDLIILDLNMPHIDGFQIIDALKALEPGDYVPILIVTAEPAHKLRALSMGARDFLTKPFDTLEVVTRVGNMLEMRLLYKRVAGHNALLEERVRERTAELLESYRETILVMTRAAENKDPDTGLHIKRIGIYCHELAVTLGMNQQFQEDILYSSSMHDVGKISIPDHILLKTSAFDKAEWEIMKSHALAGANILLEPKSPYLQMGAEIALAHHERWDGGGYPYGLRAEAIPLSARIMTLCDVYDALRSRRPYKPALDHQTTLTTITHGDGRTSPGHFDPAILEAFSRCHHRFDEIFETHSDEAGGIIQTQKGLS